MFYVCTCISSVLGMYYHGSINNTCPQELRRICDALRYNDGKVMAAAYLLLRNSFNQDACRARKRIAGRAASDS